MEQSYWPEWERFLSRWGLKTTTHILLRHARPLFPLMSQMMLLGFPLMRSLSIADQYSAILKTLGDEDQINRFSDYLQGGVK
jgi:hypothetical protein